MTDPRVVLGLGALVLAIAFGVRAAFGLFVPEISAAHGWAIGTLSFAFAVQNLLWGVMQPLAGGLADHYGAPRVMAGGGMIYALGLVVMVLADSTGVFLLGCGILVGVAQAALGFPVVLGVIGRKAPALWRSLYFGIATAGASFGQFVFAPIGQGLLQSLGWASALLALAGITLGTSALAAVLAVLVPDGQRAGATTPVQGSGQGSGVDDQPLRAVLKSALTHTGFLLLIAGFFVCGFQLAFIVVHLPMFVALCGLPASVGATGIALIGLFNVAGTLAAGQLGGRMRPKYPLAAVYALRAVAGLLFVTAPVTEGSVLAFSAVMGLLWLSTVPLTNGVILQLFGPRHVGTLFGIVFLSHQVGSFIGVLGAGLVVDHFGSYDVVWWISAGLGVYAALIHLPIDDRAAVVRAAAPCRSA